MRILMRMVGFIDRRTQALANAGRRLDDQAIERKWRAMVAANPKERRRLAGLEAPAVVRERDATPTKVLSPLEESLMLPGLLRRQGT